MLGDAIGLVVLLVPIALLGALVPAAIVPGIMWFFVYIVLAFISWHVWRMPRAPHRPEEWLRVAGAAIVVGSFFLGMDVLIGRSEEANLPLLEAAERARGFLGFAFTVTMFPAVFFIGIAGVARAACQIWRDSRRFPRPG
jgi:hypothetical protein